MKTTIDIPENELKDALNFTLAKTKREAVVTALVDFNRRQRLKKMAQKLGTFEHFMTIGELMQMREKS